MGTESKPLKIYMLPFFAQGHLIPLVNLARLVASKNQQVTIITTPSNAQLFDKIIEEEKAAGHHIRVHIINFPATQVGLPIGVENLFAASDNQTAGKISMAAHVIKPEIENFLKQNPPHVFIPDIMFTWSESTAKDLQIPRLVFNPISIFDVCMIQAIQSHPEAFVSDSGPYQIPGLPHPLTLPIKPSPGFARLTEALIKAENGSHGVIVNSFAELDEGYTEYYENLTGRKVWHVGPTSLMVENTKEKVINISNEKKHESLTWLDAQEPNSVVYISFGSLCSLSNEQLMELAIGIEDSNHKFLWVVHRKEGEDDDNWLPKGFEQKMKEKKRGMLIKGWVPQALILDHPSIGGFLTHCGWNATVEAISSGVPMITMPGFGDQYYNEKLVTEVHRIGVEVGAAEWSISPYDAKKTVVSAEKIEKGVKSLMDSDGEGGEIRKRAKEMKAKAWKAVQEGGSSQNCLTKLVDYFQSLVVPKSVELS
ncbi:unnamed protein product [Trifolium pratense]|uniref:Uncharacterized protein n=1 Tax=Trifolium pratense TaxID=57577 RepID=A0ACB0KGB3_TRIPR|nr:unnamed protein product [Trifolium pratense]